MRSAEAPLTALKNPRVTVRAAIAWAMLAGLACVSAYGFGAAHLFSQSLWLPAGLRRMEIFAACYALAAAGFIWFEPRWLGAAALAAGAAYTIAAVGIVAPLAAGGVLFSSLITGRCLFHATTDEDNALALALGLSIWSGALSLAAHYPVNYPAVYAAALAVPILWKARETVSVARGLLANLVPRGPASRMETAALSLVVFALAAQWIVALKPEVSSDGLGMHLVIPAQIAVRHLWAFDFREFTWAVMPMAGDWAYTLAYVLGGEYAARLLNFGLLALICALMHSAMRHWLSRPLAMLAVALFAATPLVQLVTGSLFVENFWAALVVAGVLSIARLRETGLARYAFAAAALAGTAVAAKFGALAFATPIVILGGIEIARLRSPVRRGRVAGVTVLIFAIFALPPYLNAWVKTGNPIFPFMNQTFRSPYFDSTKQFRNDRYTAPLAWRTLYDITFHSSRFLEGQNGSFGFQYFLLLPIVVPLIRRTWPYLARAALAVALAGFLIAFAGQPYLRYVYPALPLFTIAIFAAVCSAPIALRRALTAAAIAAFFLDVYFLPASGYYHQDFFLNLLDRTAVDRYLRFNAPERRLVDYLNGKGPEIRVAFLDRDSAGDLHGRAFSANWRSDPYFKKLAGSESAADDLRINAELGIRYFIAPAAQSGILLLHVYTRNFLDEYTVPEYQFGTYYVARLRDECWSGHCEPLGVDHSMPPAAVGVYDDLDRHIVFHGPWSRGEFQQAASRSATYTNVAGAAFDFRFTGTSVTWVFARAPNRGLVQVTIDGRDFGTLDQYGPSVEWQSSRTFGGLNPGDHSLTIRVLGMKSAQASDSFIDVDRLAVQ